MTFGAMLAAATLALPALAQAPRYEAGFLSETPIVDGVLDEAAEALTPYAFAHRFTFGNRDDAPAEITYRLGYTPTHLYLHIQTDAPAVSYHNRGYLWGDGYKLLLGLPETADGTGQYYEIGVSPTRDAQMRPHENRILTYNFTQVYRPFGPESSSVAAPNPDGSGFELLIAWSDLPPYHPWMVEAMGFNLYFAKGFETEVEGYFTHGHAVVQDEGIWDEELPLRQMTPLRFTAPDDTAAVVLAQPVRRHVWPGETLPVQLAGLGDAASRSVRLTLSGADGQIAADTTTDMTLDDRLQTQIVTLAAPDVEPGVYDLAIEGVDGSTAFEVAVLPRIAFAELYQKLADNRAGAPLGAATTLMFKLEQIQTGMAALKPYETGAHLLEAWAVFQAEFAVFDAGADPYAGRIEPYQSYPLLVFLHGSGADDQGLLRAQRGDGAYIELAPFGRDKFRAYAEPESQRDIVEAIEDVIANFSVDEDVIVMGGFSMGGYGALRAYYENPDLYVGVGVFAGHPDLANAWLGGDHPNFLQAETQAIFEGVPVFIYHGLADAGLPVGLMQQTADGLTAAGADVTTWFVPDRGHTYQDDATHAAFGEWLAARRVETTP